MAASKEIILIVENDPDISDLLARQALAPLGYQVKVVSDANRAIQNALNLTPDLIILDLDLVGISGKDLLVGLHAQNSETPIIVLAEKDAEHDVMQALRLGASDYLSLPLREAEAVAAVERGLKQVRGINDRVRLDEQLRTMNLELERKVHELRTMLSIGKAVVSVTDQRILFHQIVEGATHIAAADTGWLLLRDERDEKSFLLTAQQNLPASWAKKLNKPLEDGISSLVALSGEALSIHGEPLRRFKVSAIGRAANVTPIKAKDEVIGLLVLVRKQEDPFRANEETLLAAIADYASISLVNERLFRALRQNAEVARSNEKRQNQVLDALNELLDEELSAASFSLDLLVQDKLGTLNTEQHQALSTTQAALKRLKDTADRILPK
jgi:DNA-binding response OmpR family regulator